MTVGYQEEELSYHYTIPADYIEIKNAKIVKAIFDELNLPNVTGNVLDQAVYNVSGLANANHNMDKLYDAFFAVDDNDEIVGIIDLRYELNEFLQDFGNSGYSVRTSERRKGYATEMLRLIKEVAKRVGLTSLQLSVERLNELSVKTIKKNGGIYKWSFEFEGEIADVYNVKL